MNRVDPKGDLALMMFFLAPRDRTGGREENYRPRQETAVGYGVGQAWDDNRVDFGAAWLGTFEAAKRRSRSY